MTTFEDFTRMHRGTEVYCEGKVEPCPRCGRNGIERRPERDAGYVVHRQMLQMLSDGLLVKPMELCFLPLFSAR